MEKRKVKKESGNVNYGMESVVKNIAQLSLVIAFLSGLLLWWYLYKIHRVDLFIPSLTSIVNIYPVVLSFIKYELKILSIGLPFLVYVLFFNRKELNCNGRFYYFIVMVISSSCGFIWLLFGLSYLNCESILAPGFLCTLVMMVAISFLWIKKSYIFRLDDFLFALSSILIAVLSMVLIPGSLDDMLQLYDGRGFLSMCYIAFCFSCFIILMQFPVFIIIYVKLKGKHTYNKIGVLALFLSSLVSPVFIFGDLAIMTLKSTMEEIGIADWRRHVYWIDATRYSPDMFPRLYWNTRESQSIKGAFFISATRPFSLGDNVLLCPNYLTYVFYRSLKVNFNESEINSVYYKSLSSEMFQRCFIFESKFTKQSDTTFNNYLGMNPKRE